jgi:hypothetical protein
MACWTIPPNKFIKSLAFWDDASHTLITSNNDTKTNFHVISTILSLHAGGDYTRKLRLLHGFVGFSAIHPRCTALMPQRIMNASNFGTLGIASFGGCTWKNEPRMY